MIVNWLFLLTGLIGVNGYWHPHQHMSWNYVIGESHIDTSIHGDMFIVDLFDTPQSIIDDLHSKGKHVVCYFSAGTKEDWRPDAHNFPTALGNPDEGWKGETYIDIRNAGIKEIMKNRIALAARKHCDGVDPDNVDAWNNPTGLSFTARDQLIYNRFLADEAHRHHMSIGLKNDGLQIPDLVDYFDFAINEQCIRHGGCELYKPFVDRNKPVFNVEYVQSSTEGHQQKNSICSKKPADFNTLIKLENLHHGCHCALTNWKIGC